MKDYLNLPWFVIPINEGFTIGYVKDNMQCELPFELADCYLTEDESLVLHIVLIHNKTVYRTP